VPPTPEPRYLRHPQRPRARKREREGTRPKRSPIG
jgi:hypothetical protein